MKQLLRTVAVLISLLSFTIGNIVPIEPNGNEDYLDDCGTNNLTVQFPNLDVIDEHFISVPILRCLTIKNSRIQRVENGAFAQMPNLWYLNLQENSIHALDLFSFGNLSSVRKLILSHQGVGQSGETVIKDIYPQLRYLDLQNTGINDIKLSRENPFPELTYLDLSMNTLQNFTFMHSQAKKLTHLYLNHNKISQFSLGPSALMWLKLNYNNIRFIGEGGLDLGGLTNLKNLSLANNQIKSIRDGAFRDTVSLQHLNISWNLLSTIHPETFRNLQSLQVIILDQNSLDEVPRAIPVNITTLSISCNRIKNLTINSLYHLPHLKTLSLALNGLESIHADAFENQGMLEELYLHYNKLNYLPNDWCRNMKNLRYLDLTGNEFTTFEPTIHSSLPSLRQIYVGGNPLEFNASTFATLPKSATVYLVRDWTRFGLLCLHS